MAIRNKIINLKNKKLDKREDNRLIDLGSKMYHRKKKLILRIKKDMKDRIINTPNSQLLKK